MRLKNRILVFLVMIITTFLMSSCGGVSQSDSKTVAEHAISLANQMSQKGMSQEDIEDNIKTYWRNKSEGVGDFQKWGYVHKMVEKYNVNPKFTLGEQKNTDVTLMYSRERDGDYRALYSFYFEVEVDGNKEKDEGIMVIDKNKDGKWFVGTIYHPNY